MGSVLPEIFSHLSDPMIPGIHSHFLVLFGPSSAQLQVFYQVTNPQICFSLPENVLEKSKRHQVP